MVNRRRHFRLNDDSSKIPVVNPAGFRANPVQLVLLVVVLLAIAFRLWTSFCFFPLSEWNSVRLAPTFMLRFGPTPYPGLDGGSLTTWIYGPVPLLINLPATLAHHTISALFLAEIVNLLLAIIPATLAVFTLVPSSSATNRTDRCWALLLCLALWPNTSLQYIQADNTAVAFGLIGNLLLLRTQGGNRSLLFPAALCTALAVWSKQTALGLVLAQLLWLGSTAGFKTTWRYAVICAACGLGLTAVFIDWFGFDQLWLNLVQIPGRLPFCDDALARTRDFWMHLSGFVLLPALVAIFARRVIWRSNSPWLLPVLSWLCLLPMALISTYKIGGATNSLNGILYLLPIATVTAVTTLRRLHGSSVWVAAVVLVILALQFQSSPLLPTRPVVTHLIEGEQLADKFPRRIYFPWHPLITFFSDHRFYLTEDGLYTRHAAGIDVAPNAARESLPDDWTITAVPGWRRDGVYKQLQPPGAQFGFNGKWGIYLWPPSDRSPRR